MDETAATPITEQPAAAPRAPWYSLNPAAIGRSRLIRALAIGLLIVSFSITPVWRLLWYFPVYGCRDFVPKRDIHGHFRAAWHWIDSKEIRVYAAPGVSYNKAEEAASGARAMVSDLGLNFTVKAMPMPPAVRDAYQACLVKKRVLGQEQQCIDFSQFEARLVALRDHDQHADMVVLQNPLKDVWWASGIAYFTTGVSVMEEDRMNFHVAKHETGHLLGYLYHDSLPLYVIGYPWEGFPWNRDSLMMLYSTNDTLSPRAYDALHYFWRGMEKRSGKKFLVK